MTKPISRDPICRRRRFDAEIIPVCVRWYITYRLSYRDLVAMMAERGIIVSHTTVLALGNPLRAGVREAMESAGTTSEFLLAR
jgi:transposase-like protein